MSLLFTNLTPVSKQIQMAQYFINEHSEYDGLVIGVRQAPFNKYEHPQPVAIIELEPTPPDIGCAVKIKGLIAKDLLKLK